MYRNDTLLGHLLLKDRFQSSVALELNLSIVVNAPMPLAWSDSFSSLAPYRLAQAIHVSSVETRDARAEEAARVRQRVGRASLPPRAHSDWFSNMLAHSNYTLQNIHPRFLTQPREQVLLVFLGVGVGGSAQRPDLPDALLLADTDAAGNSLNRSVRLETSWPANQSLVRLPFTCDMFNNETGLFERTRDLCSIIPLLTSAALSARNQLLTEVLYNYNSAASPTQRFSWGLHPIDAPNGSYISLPLDALLARVPLPAFAPYLLKAQHRVSLRNHWRSSLADEQKLQTLVLSARNALRVHTDAALVFEVRERMSTSASSGGNTLLTEMTSAQSCETTTPNSVQLRFENLMDALLQRLIASVPRALGVSFELSLKPMQHRLTLAALPAGAAGVGGGMGLQLPAVESLLLVRSVGSRTEFAERLVLCANHSSFDAEENARLLDGTLSVDLNTTQSGLLRINSTAAAGAAQSHAGPLLIPLDFSVSTRLLGSSYISRSTVLYCTLYSTVHRFFRIRVLYTTRAVLYCTVLFCTVIFTAHVHRFSHTSTVEYMRRIGN